MFEATQVRFSQIYLNECAEIPDALALWDGWHLSQASLSWPLLERTKVYLEEKTCVKGISSRIWIVNVGSDDKVEMGINVSGTGDVPSIYAKRFAHCIEEEANIAEQFKYNGYAVK